MCKKPYVLLKDETFNSRVKFMSRELYIRYYSQQPSEDLLIIPCGKCSECFKSIYMEWKKRIIKEFSFHKYNLVLNLTYDNDNLKELNVRDLQLFFKRLRKHGFNVRYWFVGELGDEKKRPHYHCILFGMQMPEDAVLSNRKSKRGNLMYESSLFTKLWSYGLVTFNHLEQPEVSYLLKYLVKDIDKLDKKEFLMGYSRRPPIGINPLTIDTDIFKLNRTKAEKRYYKYRNGKVPELKDEIENNLLKIKEIEKSQKYFYYLLQKSRQ